MKGVQDTPGPDHGPIVDELGIDGVCRQHFPTVVYEHGALTELLNSGWHDMFVEPVEHLYMVNNAAGRREEWYVHRQSTDRYLLIDGALTVALFDGRPASTSYGTLEVCDLNELGSAGFAGLVIPAGVWHSFRIDSDRVKLMNAKTPGYDRENPDKFRLAMPNESTPFTWDAYPAPVATTPARSG